MEKEIGQGRRSRASGFGQPRRTSRVLAQRVSASALLLLAAALNACGSDDASPGVTTDTESQNPAPGPSTAPDTTTPANPAPSDGQGAMDPANPTPSANEGSGDGMLPLEPGAMEGETSGEAPTDTPPAEETRPTEEPPVEEPPVVEPTAFNPCPTDGSACRIMPLGDSITDGLVGNAPGNTAQSAGGYRIELFRRAVADGHAIAFVGRQQNGPNNVDGQQFSRNHEGYSGATISTGMNQLANRVDAALDANPPDIILLQIGTNNIYQGMPANLPDQLEALLNQITTGAPDALVVVAQITPVAQTAFPNNGVSTYNAAIPAIVQEQVDAGKHVVVVDQFTPIASSPNTVAGLVGDNIHPNAAGYALMAEAWYGAIESFLP